MALPKLSPRSETLAFRIWSYAGPRGWDLTLQELADGLGETMEKVRSICMLKRWGGRLRVTSCDVNASASSIYRGGGAWNRDFGVGELA